MAKHEDGHTMPKTTKDTSDADAQKMAHDVCKETGGKTGGGSGNTKKTGRY